MGALKYVKKCVLLMVHIRLVFVYTVQCIEKLTKYLRYACETSPHAYPPDVLVRLLVSELV